MEGKGAQPDGVALAAADAADAASRGRADADAIAATGCGLSRTDAVAAGRGPIAGPDAGLRLLALRQNKRERLGRRGPGARARICG